MNMHMKKLRDATLAFLLGALPLGNALADDIEIYVGADNDLGGVPPNILFVIDTSGSMSGQVEMDGDTSGGGLVTQTPYDPNTVYSGTCISSRYYWDDDSDFPDCSTDQYIESTAFFCQAALDAFNASGRFMDRYASWRDRNGTNNDYWTDVSDNAQTRYTECKTDSGTHGNGGTSLYAANRGNGPWSSDATQSIDWDDQEILTFMSGNFLNWYHSATASEPATRLEVVQYVTKTLLDSVSNVNFGLMRFDTGAAGGMVLFPVEDVGTNRDAMKTAIDTLTPGGGTPLSETYYEAIQYYRGSNVDFGLDSKVNFTSVPSVAESRGNGDSDLLDTGDDQYRSPIQYQCQKNFIVFLTDGEPTSDSHAGSKIQAWPGFDSLNDSCHSSISGDCLDEAALWARNRDVMPNMNGDQNVITYMVGFAEEVSVLEETAQKGGGDFYLAYDARQLLNVFTNIIAEILAINSTFTAPAVSVNAFNRTVHRDQLFFTVFKPSERPHWNGNVKRFDLGYPEGSDELQIIDVNSNPAVDPNTGFFADTAVSFWTQADQSPDGGEAALGGASGMLSATRKIYSYMGNEAGLSNTPNLFHESNTGITKAMLGIDAQTDAYRTTLLQWARGIDVNDDDDDGLTTDARRIMGDPLHSKPVVVTYGGTNENPDFTVFMTTNDGFLHAINGVTGAEHFAFIPRELFSNLNVLYENNAGVNNKAYGLDSPITAWVKDVDNDGIVETADGDHVYIYFGQRRGGKNYYALDVTNRAAPEFLWQITADSTTGYSELAQTWAPPKLARINVNGTAKDVIVFSGGYDANQDTADIYVDDSEGRAVYIADALTGDLIWWAGPSGSGANLELADLKSSIPAEVRVIDMDSDGFHDRMYASDVGGRIFRFDIINGQPAATLVKGGKIASLGAGDMATPTEIASRKFFYPPDAALIVDGTTRFINLAIGSGNQDHPLGKSTQDRLFSIRDPNVFNVPATYTQADGTVITESDLHDATDNLVAEGTAEQKEVALTQLADSDGWYIDLENVSTGAMEGEKSLSEATTLQGNIFFTTFTPVSTNSNSCAPSQGLARAYLVSATTAEAVENFDGYGSDDALTREDRAMNLTRGGIPPEVTILFPESGDGKPLPLVGPEELPVKPENFPVRTYWYEADGS